LVMRAKDWSLGGGGAGPLAVQSHRTNHGPASAGREKEGERSPKDGRAQKGRAAEFDLRVEQVREPPTIRIPARPRPGRNPCLRAQGQDDGAE
jgi:hypothetical protein